LVAWPDIDYNSLLQQTIRKSAALYETIEAAEQNENLKKEPNSNTNLSGQSRVSSDNDKSSDLSDLSMKVQTSSSFKKQQLQHQEQQQKPESNNFDIKTAAAIVTDLDSGSCTSIITKTSSQKQLSASTLTLMPSTSTTSASYGMITSNNSDSQTVIVHKKHNLLCAANIINNDKNKLIGYQKTSKSCECIKCDPIFQKQDHSMEIIL